MRFLHAARWFLMALIFSIIPASLHAQILIGISVGFAPPEMPVYVQPQCPQPNLMWTPAYWAYGDDGYYWVPGAWVPAPYEGALWTPPYWGWNNGNYAFNEGYWGNNIGYYGGVNYGFGYGGIGFAGGEWRGGTFAYNTAVMHVDTTIIHTTYVNETIVRENIVENPGRVAYNGGPGGIQHQATVQETIYTKETHVRPTTFQQQHTATAKADTAAYAKNNGGHPTNLVAAKPLAEEKATPPATQAATEAHPAETAKPAVAEHPAIPAHPAAASHPAAAAHPAPAARPKAATPPATTAHLAAASHALAAPHVVQAAQNHPAAQPRRAPAPLQRAAVAPKPTPKEEHEPK